MAQHGLQYSTYLNLVSPLTESSIDHNSESVNIYRPQTKLWKGNVFTSVCQEFCPQVGAGVCLSACLDTPSLGRHLPRQTPPPGQTPPRQTPPWADTHPVQTQPRTAADGTHPTGMHSCCKYNSTWTVAIDHDEYPWSDESCIRLMHC